MKNKNEIVCPLFDEFCSLFGNRPGKVFILDLYAYYFIDDDLFSRLDNREFIYHQLCFDLIGAGINLDVNTLAIEEFNSYIKFLSRCIDDNNRTPF